MERMVFVGDKINYKSLLIPQEWKDDIDQILTEGLLNANRYFATINPHLSKLIEREASKTPQSFYLDLSRRWEWHNEFYESFLEPSLGLMLEEGHFELSPFQVRCLMQAYEAASLVDQATLVASAATKAHLNRWVGDMEFLSEDERNMLLTPPVDSFWVQYLADHIDYVIALKRGGPDLEGVRRSLIDKYHAGDEVIIDGRLKRFARYFDMSVEDLESKKKSAQISREYKIKHFYFTLERPRLRAIRNVVAYDNVEEYRILVSLIGISGFILRKRILHYLNEAKILRNDGNIYDFEDSVIIRGLRKLLRYREEVMDKAVEPYMQTSDTCGVACLMMAMHHLGKSDLDVETESGLNFRTKSKYIDGNHFSGLAREAGKVGLETVLVHSEKKMFKNERFFTPQLFSSLVREYSAFLAEARKCGTKVLNGVDITSETVKGYLENGFLVILAGQVGGILHAILVTGYNSQGFAVCDPLRGKKEFVNAGYLTGFMRTPIGSWMLALREDRSSLKKLRKSLPSFIKQAKTYLY